MEIARRGSGLDALVCHRGDDDRGQNDDSRDDLPGVEGDGHWDIISDDGSDWGDIGSEESRSCIDGNDDERESGSEEDSDDGGVRIRVRVRLRRWNGKGEGGGTHVPHQEVFTNSDPSNDDDDWELISWTEGTPKSENHGSDDQRANLSVAARRR